MKWLVLIVLGFAALGGWVLAAPSIADALVVEKKLSQADAIYILSGSSTFRQRVERASELYSVGVSKTVLLTDDGQKAGWSTKDQVNPRFVDLAADLLVRKGVDRNDVRIIEATVSGTYEEAKTVSEVIKGDGNKSLLLVTSKYHSGRAYNSFANELGNSGVTLGITSAEDDRYTPSRNSWWLSPKGWKVIGGEYLKSVIYYVFF